MTHKPENRKKLLYIMHVSWYWIKQRPHFLALHLSNSFDTTILYPKSVRYIRSKSSAPDNCKGIPQWPLSRFSFIKMLNKALFRHAVKQKLKNTDILWIGNPDDFELISDLVAPDVKVVYDCMDDLCEFPGINASTLKNIISAEQQLINKADVLLASSQHLKNVLQTRYQSAKPIEVVNNAIDISFLNVGKTNPVIEYPIKRDYTDILYIGTISEWFNFPLMLKAMNQFASLRLILIGPKCAPIPEHERIIHLGSKAHTDLPAYMAKCDALVMPFVINDLILAVNPVKLYEYLVAGKPVITCHYAEIDPFGSFVFPYDSDEKFLEYIEKLILGKLHAQPEAERIMFLNNNTWAQRAALITSILNG